jgi:hypothetical protein
MFSYIHFAVTAGLFMMIPLYLKYDDISEWVERRVFKTVVKTINAFNATESQFVLHDAAATIHYDRMGHTYQFSMPYSRKMVAKMSQIKVYLHKDHESVHDITQQPGIPYVVTAHDLGGNYILALNEDNGETFRYEKDTKPGYCIEVFE